MARANQLLDKVAEGNKTKELYNAMRKMESSSWNSFMSDIQGALSANGEKTIPTDKLSVAFKYLLSNSL